MDVNYSSTPLLDIRNATVVRGGRRILDSVSLSIADGEHVAIVGPNGSGKSTLIKLITRQIYPQAALDPPAAVEIFGKDRWDVFELRSMLGILSSELQQDFTSDDSLEAIDSVVSGFFASKGVASHHSVTQEMLTAGRNALDLVGASALAERRMSELSTGEARRVLIARALAPGPRALILDEPTAGLDIAARRRFLHVVQRIARERKAVILVTHHVEEIIPEIGRVILMKDGKVYLDGPKDELLTSELMSALLNESIRLRKHGGYYSAEIE